MQPSTQKQQSEEFHRLIEAEHRILVKRFLRTIARYMFVFLAIFIPVLAVALGWIRD